MPENDPSPAGVRGAVFLSYASEDAVAVRRIAEALRGIGIEVWFDQDELAGGDAWDRKIREQIKSCALFVPVISANTEARAEGYFRLEWRVADQRTHLMGRAKAFLLPVCVDKTKDIGADVPDSFLAIQWLRLPDGEVSPAFTARVRALLDPAAAADPAALRAAPAAVAKGAAAPLVAQPAKKFPWWIIAVVAAGGGAAAVLLLHRSAPPAPIPMTPPVVSAPVPAPAALTPPPAAAVAVVPSPAPTPAARAAGFPADPELKRALSLIYAVDAGPDDTALAEEIALRAMKERPDDVDAVVVYAAVENYFLSHGIDRSEARSALARKFAERAALLAPQNPDALNTLASYLYYSHSQLPRAEELVRTALKLEPRQPRYYRTLLHLVGSTKPLETPALIERMEAMFPTEALLRYDVAGYYRDRNQLPAMERALTATLSLGRMTNALVWKGWLSLWWQGEVGNMGAWLDRVPERQGSADRIVFARYVQGYISGRPNAALKLLSSLPENWLVDVDYTGPKGLLTGDLLLLEGQKELARVQYEAALTAVNAEIARDPTDLGPRRSQVWTLYRLGRLAEAKAANQLIDQSAPRPYRISITNQWWFSLIPADLLLGEHDRAMGLIREGEVGLQERTLLRNMLRLDPRMAPWRRDPVIAPLLQTKGEPIPAP
jgi:tetratricopeptide (TPR) repeat protein